MEERKGNDGGEEREEQQRRETKTRKARKVGIDYVKNDEKDRRQ